MEGHQNHQQLEDQSLLRDGEDVDIRTLLSVDVNFLLVGLTSFFLDGLIDSWLHFNIRDLVWVFLVNKLLFLLLEIDTDCIESNDSPDEVTDHLEPLSSLTKLKGVAGI